MAWFCCRVKTWMGGALVDRFGPLMLNVNANRWMEPTAMITPANMDDLKRAYMQVRWEAVDYGARNPADTLLLLTPTDPLAPHAPPAAELTLHLDVASQMDTRLSGTTGMGDHQLARQTMSLTIALPAPAAPAAQSLFTYIDPHWKQRVGNFGGYETLPAAVDSARALFYGACIDTRNPDRPHIQRSLMYSEKYFVESACPWEASLSRILVAQNYALLGNKPRARQLIQAILDDKRLDASLQPAGNPLLASIPASARKRIQDDARQNLKRQRDNAREALNTWAK